MRLIHGDCLEEMNKLIDEGIKVDTILTSPPYNISKTKGKAYALKTRGYFDCMDNDDYIKWLLAIFEKFNIILEKNGVIIWNMNYGTNNNETMWLFLAELIKNTNFTIADNIIWKKPNALPNNCSSNKITRITENIFIICRKKEYKTFHMNKKVVSIRKTGQKMYENKNGFIEAPNNDKEIDKGTHKSSFSTELVVKLLNLYGGNIIMDIFTGIGTTGIACKKMNKDFIGIELNDEYFKIAQKRINNTVIQNKLFGNIS